MKAREVKRAKLVAKYAAKRAALKKVIATAEDPVEAYEAARSLQAIPANANPIRLHKSVFTTAAKSLDVQEVSCVSLDSLVSSSARWHLLV